MKKIREVKDSSQPKSVLFELAREGAREMIQMALLAEREEFLEQHSHLLTSTEAKRFVKNGFHRERCLEMPAGEIALRVPRVRDRDGQQDAIAFRSKLLPPYLRRSKELDEFIPFLYLKGISSNDFSEVLTSLLGAEVSFSPTSLVRLKKAWHEDFDNWQDIDLSAKKYVYWWVDGIHFNVRLTGEKSCILVVMGATSSGKKELIAVQDGHRESEISWLELLRGLKRRGLNSAPHLVTGDGALGFWKALRKEFSEAREQRCWVHKTANVLDKLPKSVQAGAKSKIHDIYLASTKGAALSAFDDFVEIYESKYPKAVECLVKDKEETMAFYDCPAEHWVHIRSTNPIESTFATVRLRTRKTKGAGSAKETLMMVFKLAQCAEKRWRRLRGYKKIPLVLQGKKFVDGELKEAA